jgi:hypothetical protein
VSELVEAGDFIQVKAKGRWWRVRGVGAGKAYVQADPDEPQSYPLSVVKFRKRGKEITEIDARERQS